jgi:hypothetical protein
VTPPTAVWSTRPIRRAAVVLTYLSYLSLVVLWEPSKALGAAWLAVVGTFGLLTIMGYVLLVVFQLTILFPQPDRTLDERQRAIQDRSVRVAYNVLAAGVLVGAFCGLIAADSGRLWLPRTFDALQAVFWGVWLVVTTLPAAVLC